MSDPIYVGVDVSKRQLDLVELPSGRAWHVPNAALAHDALVATWRATAPALIVLEASGGFERAIVAALSLAGLPVVLVNPRQVRDFAKGTGQLAKTDRLDAHVLAHFAATIRPVPRILPDAATHELAALVARRQQLTTMLVAERLRRRQAVASLRADLTQHIRWLERRLKKLDGDLDRFIHQSPLWCANESLLRSVPGIGPTIARTLIARLPELGRLTRQELAALAGVAPFARESGTWRGRRHIGGGRRDVRQMIYLAALTGRRCNPLLRARYERLRAAGKPVKVALIALARQLLTILNAIIRRQQPWQLTVDTQHR